ncbi:MAG: hypothetical protein GYB42_00235 [Alphaproteobacteria bacterium]|nr:hypothetical protein [Alphaproteobacteria bacterium]
MTLSALPPEEALVETAGFAAVHAGLCLDAPASLPWLVSASVLMAQQACALALKAAGDHVPTQAGATELLLRASARARLPAPHTLPFSGASRRSFDALVEARNAHMHPRAAIWHITPPTLARGLPAACDVVRHLILVQPVLPDMVSPTGQKALDEHLRGIEALAEFLGDG